MSKRKPSGELNSLKDFWYKELEKSGFVDIEDSRQNLKQPNIRTVAYQNRDIILEFFLKLDVFLNERRDLNTLHRKILEFYSSGMKHIKIAKLVNRSPRTIRRILARYKREINNGHLI